MEKLRLENIENYKNAKKLGFSISGSIARIIDQSINNFKVNNQLNKNSIIVVYWNSDEKWLQIMDNSNGLSISNIDNLWSTSNSETAGFTLSCFYLGNIVTFESKNADKGFKTSVNLNDSNVHAPLEYMNSTDMMRTFPTGTRCTIDKLNVDLSIEEAQAIREDLSFKFHSIVSETNINIIFAYIKDQKTYDVSTNEPKEVTAINQVSKLKSNIFGDNDNQKIIKLNDTIEVSKKPINIEIEIIQQDNISINGISFGINNRIISSLNNLLRPMWFNNDFSNLYVNVKFDNDLLNLYKNDISLNELELNKILESIKLKILPFKKINISNSNNEPKKEKTKLIEQDDWKETKQFLTKAFTETGKIDNFDDFEILKDKLRFTYNADDGKKITINLIKSKQKDIKDEWLQLIPINEERLEQIYEYDLKLNLNHPYFIDFIDNQKFVHKLEHFVICYALAECITRLDGSPVTQIKYEINKLLRAHNDK